MKIISWNVNGIRAIEKKGELETLLRKENPDVLLLQEIKARKDQLSEFLTINNQYWQYYHSAEKVGYSGVSIWVRKKTFKEEPAMTVGMKGWNDSEGRIIRVDLANVIVFGVYFPNGGKSEEAWLDKLKFYDHFLDHVNELRADNKRVVWSGDLNVAHNPLDLARPKENEGNIGFRPEERSWLDRVIKDNWIDIFRKQNPELSSYTWWQMRTRARDRNVGWRIDYFFIDQADKPSVKTTGHLKGQKSNMNLIKKAV